MRLIGFSTGCLYRTNLTINERVAAIKKTGAGAIELGGLNLEKDFFSDFLDGLSPEELAGFAHVSFHAPLYPYRDDGVSVHILRRIAFLQEKLRRRFDAVVFHPDSVLDFSLFENLPYPVAFENMDSRKKCFRNPADIQALLEQYPAFSFVFDVAHAFDNDPTGVLANEFRGQLNHRIIQIHVSGSGKHEPLHSVSYWKQARIIYNYIWNSSAPYIIESILTPETLALELGTVAIHTRGSSP